MDLRAYQRRPEPIKPNIGAVTISRRPAAEIAEDDRAWESLRGRFARHRYNPEPAKQQNDVEQVPDALRMTQEQFEKVWASPPKPPTSRMRRP